MLLSVVFQAEDGIREAHWCLEFRRVLFRSTDTSGGHIMPATLADFLSNAEFVVVVLPLNDQTKGLDGPREFAQMKPGAILINGARGPIVDENALLDALNDGTLRAAGLDVFATEPLPPDSPLRRDRKSTRLNSSH